MNTSFNINTKYLFKENHKETRKETTVVAKQAKEMSTNSPHA